MISFLFKRNSLRYPPVCRQKMKIENTSIVQKATLELMADPTIPYTGISIYPATSRLARPIQEQIALYRIFPLPIK